jgi:hypothetical protein
MDWRRRVRKRHTATACAHLQRLLLLHHLLVRDKVPLGGRREARVALLDAHHLVDPQVQLLDVLVRLVDRLVVRPHPVRFQQGNVALIERAELLVLVALLGIIVRKFLLVGRRRLGRQPLLVGHPATPVQARAGLFSAGTAAAKRQRAASGAVWLLAAPRPPRERWRSRLVQSRNEKAPSVHGVRKEQRERERSA